MSDDQKIWCRLCQVFVKKSDLKRWTGDDQLHWLCPGCDSDLIENETGWEPGFPTTILDVRYQTSSRYDNF